MTGLLYLIVIVMWAVVLVPIWLKSHDRTQTEKNLLEEGEVSPQWRWRQREPMSPRQLAFVRRRRVAMVLFTALVATLVLGSSGIIPIYWTALPVVMIAGFQVPVIDGKFVELNGRAGAALRAGGGPCLQSRR